MPSKVSDIHEISVIIGILESFDCNRSIQEKFQIFNKYTCQYSDGKINPSKEDFCKKENLFNRGVLLGQKLKDEFKLQGRGIKWSATKNQKEDSSDIYSDRIGISLKDSSKIIRNSGFSQLIDVFCEQTIKNFKEPFWEFAPHLSVEYLRIVIKDCYQRGFFQIRDQYIYIDTEKKREYKGSIGHLLNLSLKDLILSISKSDIKLLVKNFSKNGNLKDLLFVREKITHDVSFKVISLLREGLIQNPEHFSNKIRYMLQYRDNEKLFGFSSIKFIYAGIIKKRDCVNIKPIKIHHKKSKLTDRTMGLQINIYTTIDIHFKSHKEQLTIENQLRYKHRTFSSAPEANFHVLNYNDWRKIYPTN